MNDLTGGIAVILLVPALVAGVVYLLWRLGPGLEQDQRGKEAVEPPAPPPRRFERPWRLGMLYYGFALAIWILASVLRLVPFTRLEFLACVVPFASMSLFGLYTGEITFRDSTVRRETSPIRFWLYFGLDTLIAGLLLYLVAAGKVRMQ